MNKRLLSILFVFTMIVYTYVNVGAVKIMRGDVNNDGEYNTVDYLLLRMALADSEKVDLSMYDVNGDNSFDLQDAKSYADYLVKTGSLKIDEKAGWYTVYDWENEAVGSKPSYVIDNYTNSSVQNLSRYLLTNNRIATSTKALALFANGIVDSSASNTGSNPTTGQENTYIITQNLLTDATNLRVSLSTSNTSDSQYFCAYIGCQIGYKHYFYKIDNESYKEGFNYFYFVGKKFTRFSNNDRFTYLDEKETRVLTKEDISSIKKIDFWAESTKTTIPLLIDDISYYDGYDGYDSANEDNALPVTQDDVNDGTVKYLSIAFDDGPQVYSATKEYYMTYYMDLAKEYDAHFTFCLVGNNFKSEAVDILKRAVNEGHELGNHTWSHNRLTSLSDEKVVSEITRVDNWLYENIGVKTSFIRYPFYDTNSNVVNLIKNNCNNIKASIYGDCPNDYNNTSVDYRKWYYRRFITDGTITLTHENYIDNVETVRRILEYYSKLGYKFVTVSEMFELKGVNPDITRQYYTVK